MSLSSSVPDSKPNIPPLLIKQEPEVKLEPEANPSIQLPPSTLYLENPLIKAQSTLLNLFSCLQSVYPLLIAKELQTLSWSLFKHNPIDLSSLSNYKSEYENLKLENKPQADPPKRKRVVKGPYKKKKQQPEKTITGDGNTKNEGQEDGKEKCLIEENTEHVQKDPAKKKPQNRIKNIPGLIIQRVRGSIKTFFTISPATGLSDKRLAYVRKRLGSLNDTERGRLLNFLERYEKGWKTWNTIQKYLKTDIKYGNMLLGVVLEFFGEDGRKDFEEWVLTGKMCKKTKEAVVEMKEKIYKKYCQLLDLEHNEIKGETMESLEKIVKKEEVQCNREMAALFYYLWVV